jgi:hypothetical protein
VPGESRIAPASKASAFRKIARVAQVLEHQHAVGSRLGEHGVRRGLEAALAHGEAAVVELEAHDLLHDLEPHEKGPHAGRVQRGPEGLQRGRRHQRGPRAIAAGAEEAEHHLAALGDEGAGAQAPLRVPDIAIVGEARVLRIFDGLDGWHGAWTIPPGAPSMHT